MRQLEPGWILCAMNDSTGRRGVWYRKNSETEIELCGGREGDDEYIKLTLTPKEVHDLESVLCVGAWMCEALPGGRDPDENHTTWRDAFFQRETNNVCKRCQKSWQAHFWRETGLVCP